MRARKRFGQHFLEGPWADRLVAAIRPMPDDEMVEIGPGRGALTFRLAKAVRRLTAVEIDRDLVAELTPRLPPTVTVIEGDFLDMPLTALVTSDTSAANVRVVGNLPYNISSPILFRLLALHRSHGAFRDATVMLQREVADRVVASPGSKTYGVLSIAMQMDADCSVVLALPPGAFRPAPAVSSAVVTLRFRQPAVDVIDRRLFDGMVRTLFNQRRKTTANSLKPLATIHGFDAATLLRSVGIAPDRRPETLHLAELAQIANRLAAQGLATVV